MVRLTISWTSSVAICHPIITSILLLSFCRCVPYMNCGCIFANKHTNYRTYKSSHSSPEFHLVPLRWIYPKRCLPAVLRCSRRSGAVDLWPTSVNLRCVNWRAGGPNDHRCRRAGHPGCLCRTTVATTPRRAIVYTFTRHAGLSGLTRCDVVTGVFDSRDVTLRTSPHYTSTVLMFDIWGMSP